ncbi:MAG: hypothetical protein E5V89_20620 [Mesorhizobium sp.]|nr:MAG: hypothetical protein E5V89_20620 [Mesorhizobium sp.]
MSAVPVPIRFVIVISRWALLGISAVDCVVGQNKKAAGQAARVRPSGIARWPERQLCLWRPPLDAFSVAREELVCYEAGTVPVSGVANNINEINYML